MTPHDFGRNAALSDLGLVKEAAGTPLFYKAPLAKRMKTWLGNKARSLGRSAGEMAIGSPRRFGRELASGRAFGKGSLIRESFHAPDMLSKVLFYGFPAYEAGSVMLDDDPHKARRIGASLGGAALGLAAWRPLGMVGSMGADYLGRGIGGALGQTVGHVAGQVAGHTPTQTPTGATAPAKPNRILTPTRTGRTLGAMSQLSG
jgi:hypothetical protein